MGNLNLKNWRVVYISTYIPRKCGLATFTKDLTNSINLLNPEYLAEIIALDNPEEEVKEYPWEVSRRIGQNNWSDYERVLRYLNQSSVDLVVIQHEFGIWGGTDGELVVKFLEKLKKPCVIVLHTILSRPTTHQREIMNYFCQRAGAIVVMLRAAADVLRCEYTTDPSKIVVINHGVPDLPRQSPEIAKSQFQLDGKIVMSSINLLSESKGIEYAIQALPAVLEKHPNFLYLVIGETHPMVRSREGERYRIKLQELVHELRLESSVQFISRYLSLDELVRYIQASDFYVTPYLNPEQAASGSLAYAIGAGKVCLSTPYFYAREMLRRGRGVLVPFRNSKALSNILLDLMNYFKKRQLIEKKAYTQGRFMTWHRVALDYIRLFTSMLEKSHLEQSLYLSPPSLDYVHKLTTNLGILEHGKLNSPNKIEGYTVDDNAKALIVALAYGSQALIRRYFTFLIQAERDGLFYNDRSINGNWVGEPGCGDWWSKALWAISCLISIQPSPLLRKQGLKLFTKMYIHLPQLTSPRTISYALLGLCTLTANHAVPKDFGSRLLEDIDKLSNKLINIFEIVAKKDWEWFEPYLTYDNARLPQALLVASRFCSNIKALSIGRQSLDWLIQQTFDKKHNCFSFIGCHGWYYYGGTRAIFDQQPIEPNATTEACLTAYHLTKEKHYQELAKKAFAWYHGDNILYQNLIDCCSGGVFDGLTSQGVNKNQGAESVLSYHLSFLSLQSLLSSNLFINSTKLWQ
ncbi:MAG: glycosyltransferase family 4 protein [Patescibacteria group bacterium]